MSYIKAIKGTIFETGRDKSKPIVWDLISTFSHKHEGAVGESLGPEAIAGHLVGENGQEVKVDHLDMQLDSLEKITSIISTHRSDIIGISIKIGAVKQVDQLIKAISTISWKRGRKPLIVLGGIMATFATTDLLDLYPQTVLVKGEGEVASQMLIEVARGNIMFEKIPGIAFINRSGKVIINKYRLWPLKNLHLPARITTRRIHNELKGMIWAEDSRGCDFGCTFCSRRALRNCGFSGLSPKRIVDDLKQLIDMNIHKISFTGDDFSGDPEKTSCIADEILQRGIQLQWSISTRADHIFNRKNTPKQNTRLRQIMKHCAEAGLVRVFLGLESGSQSQLNRYGKQITVKENYRAIEILKELGIDVIAGYIAIDYLMTITELHETLDFLEKTGMGYKISNPLSVLRVQAGSAYVKLLKHEGLLGKKTEDLVFYKAHFKDSRIELIAQLADKWVEDLYPLIFELKGEVATATLEGKTKESSARNIESTLFSFRHLELKFLRCLVNELEKNETIDLNAIKVICKSYLKKRKNLLDWVKNQLVLGSYGSFCTVRLLTCLKDVV